MSENTSSALYLKLCEVTGLAPGTDAQVVVDAHTAQLNRRAALAGLPAGTSVPEIVAAERSVRLAAALRASAPIHVEGVKVLSHDEAQEVLLFGVQSRAEVRRVEATEAHYGKSLREALETGDLR